MLHRLIAVLLALVLGWSSASLGQSGGQDAQSAGEESVFLVAHPQFRDVGYRQTVLIAAPVPNGGHVGVIINRPTNRSLISFFPEHEPSKRVTEAVRYGGPFSPGALVALVKTERSPGAGTLPLMKDLFIAFRASTIDKVIEDMPNEARYFVGYVGWRPGELKAEIDRGLWAVVHADRETVFRKDMSRLWEELVALSRQLRAGAAEGSAHHPTYPQVAALNE